MKKILFLFLLIVLCGCGGGVVFHSNSKPDDNISETLMDVIDDDFWYIGKREIGKNDYGYEYSYLIRKQDPQTFDEILDTIIEFDLQDNKLVQFSFFQETSNGVYDPLFYLKNYALFAEDQTDTFSHANCLHIQSVYGAIDEKWRDPYTYTEFECIRVLIIPDSIQTKADDEGIDWFEVWPELEKVIVYDASDGSIVSEISGE